MSLTQLDSYSTGTTLHSTPWHVRDGSETDTWPWFPERAWLGLPQENRAGPQGIFLPLRMLRERKKSFPLSIPELPPREALDNQLSQLHLETLKVMFAQRLGTLWPNQIHTQNYSSQHRMQNF